MKGLWANNLLHFFKNWKWYLHVEEKCRLFGLHFEPMCYGAQEIEIPVSQETCTLYSGTSFTAYTRLSCSHTWFYVCLCVHLYTLWTYGPPSKFCYDRLNTSNFVNKFVWVRKDANPNGPNKIWVPKSTPIVFDVGGLSLDVRVLVPWWWMRSELNGDNFGWSLSRKVWWEDHHGLET